MSLVLRLARLPAVSTFSDILYCSARQRQQFRQQQSFGFHYYAALNCQPNLKRTTTHPTDDGPIDKSKFGSGGKADNNSTSPTAETAAKPQFTQNVKNTFETTTKEKSQTRSDDCGDEPQTAKPPSPANNAAAKPKLSREAVRQNVRGYVFTRYFDYVKNYDKVLEKNFPGAFKLYRVFFDGVRDFFADMKRYVKVWRIANSSTDGLRALNRKELELFMQMPRDMVKVAPALLGTSLPMVGYAFFPLVFMYPRRFLTSHFWTLQQRNEFQQLQLQERFTYNRAVFRYLQAKLKSTKKHKLHSEFANILGLLGSGFHPTVESVIAIKEIFAEAPYSLQSLSGKHIKNLIGMHGLPGGLSKRFRLTEHAFLVHHMDLAIGREGGVHNMPLDAIEKSCAIRGLNPANMSKEQMIAWLRNWIAISTAIEEEHISLFLHLPIFLAYNHPNNWKLIYGSNKLKDTPNENNSSSDHSQHQQQQ